ncbi:hypothetical protein [Thermincola potens]|uniref:Uncharacterized protein n=1 Tax=Thermincola potens (strain JR) TaxID=635013 RepID=D5XDS8_THEPJ|nr:hypothetical protein [Thermincola potens]ADG83824.1 conserved hypothetical protein [Thermincola potens JR]
MNKKTIDKTKNRLTSKIKTAQEVPIFSQQQINTFNSKYVDSLDEVLAVLDETNVTPDLKNME